jgi:argininosuccinate lyase
MPAYTHYQPAVPITYGHYLAGVAESVDVGLRALLGLVDELDRSPLGAGAVGGTTVAIDPESTARLLGFSRPSANSVEAVASRDVVLRLLAEGAVLGVLLSRVAADMLLWATQEFAFLDLPDALCGSSSMMPQKRNPFVLEHVQGLAAAPGAAFVHATTAMHKTPFSNSVAVGTESVRPAVEALRHLTDAITLLRLVVAYARPRPERMAERAAAGYTTATELATRLALSGGGFRRAHDTVGALARAAADAGAASLEAALDPAAAAQRAAYGGGPGGDTVPSALARLRKAWLEAALGRRRVASAWQDAAAELERVVREIA